MWCSSLRMQWFCMCSGNSQRSDDHLNYERASPEQRTGAESSSTCRWGQMLWCSSLRRRHWTSSRILAITPWLRHRPAQRLSALERCPGLRANLVSALPLTGIALRSSLASCMDCPDSCPCSSRLPENRIISCSSKMSTAMKNAQPWRQPRAILRERRPCWGLLQGEGVSHECQVRHAKSRNGYNNDI